MTKKNSDALKAAKKICGEGQCFSPFGCGHENRVDRGFPKLGTLKECPLAKYNIEPSKEERPWYERPLEETMVTNDDIFELCANCEHAKVVKEGEWLHVERLNLEGACLDCPVKSCEDGIQEAAAEAAMS